LIFAGVVLRLGSSSLPNFAPVASMALFAGYLLRDWRWGVAVPVGIMAITDQVLGGYEWALMSAVYTCLAIPVFLGKWAHGKWEIAGGGSSGQSNAAVVANVARIVGVGIVSSLMFFLVTNFATWGLTSWYEKTPAGLWLCFVKGLEFFRWTLAGDTIFSVILFSAYAVAVQVLPLGSPRQSTAS